MLENGDVELSGGQKRNRSQQDNTRSAGQVSTLTVQDLKLGKQGLKRKGMRLKIHFYLPDPLADGTYPYSGGGLSLGIIMSNARLMMSGP